MPTEKIHALGRIDTILRSNRPTYNIRELHEHKRWHRRDLHCPAGNLKKSTKSEDHKQAALNPLNIRTANCRNATRNKINEYTSVIHVQIQR